MNILKNSLSLKTVALIFCIGLVSFTTYEIVFVLVLANSIDEKIIYLALVVPDCILLLVTPIVKKPQQLVIGALTYCVLSLSLLFLGVIVKF